MAVVQWQVIAKKAASKTKTKTKRHLLQLLRLIDEEERNVRRVAVTKTS